MKLFKSFTPEVIRLLKSGAVGIIPTDTVYGIVTTLSDIKSVERIYQLKKRPLSKPIGTIIFFGTEQIAQFTDASEVIKAQKYWPGPNSVILTVSPELDYAHKGLNSLPFRVPDDKKIQAILEETGPLATTSANISGLPTIENIKDAHVLFGDSVDFYVDGGNLSNKRPSNIIRIKMTVAQSH